MGVLTQASKENPYLELLRYEFPEISCLEIDKFNYRMEPIPYHNGYCMVEEIPPTFYWKIGKNRYSFAPRPSFRRIKICGLWPFISDREGEEPYYGDNEFDAVRDAIRSTVVKETSKDIKENT